MKNLRFYFYFSVLITLFCGACKSTKYVPQGDYLYTGSELEISSDASKRLIKKIKTDLDDQIKPKPNERIFGLPLKLNLYSFIGKPKKNKGLRYSISTKFGEAPVLFSSVNPSYTQKALTAALYNNGFFDAEVTYTIKKNDKRKKVNLTYIVKSGPLYRIDSYTNKITDTAMARIINDDMDKSRVKEGRRYDLEKIKNDRERINELLKNNGYYHFNPEYLVYEADTSGTRDSVTMRLKLKQKPPQSVLQRYKMDQVYVILDSTYAKKHNDHLSDTVRVDHVTLSLDKDFKPGPIAQYVYLKDSTYYSRKKQQLTISRLMGMNLFKYVDIELQEKDSSSLDAYIHLSPLPKRSITIEGELVSKSNNFIGPGANLNYSDRNFLKGGEKLSIGLHGSIETQLNGQFKGLYTYEFGPQVNFSFPRFIVPFKVKPNSYFTPNTIVTSSYTFLNRVNYFQMRTLQISYGYKWKETLAKEHYLKPFNLNFFNISHISDDFNALLVANPALRRRYENQLILGTMYSYTYNEQVYPSRKNQFYFNGNAEIAGNTVDLINKMTGSPKEANGVKTLAGVAYAQYLRLDVDLHNYLKITRQTVFATRFIAGLGIPYGNSTTLPFVRAFFAGGTNSLRAFPVNSVGPGSYQLPDSSQGSYFIQQGGDIKLETSAELRFPIVSIIKGAFFVDMGNVWLYGKSSAFPGGEFNMNKVLPELAAGGGFGLRADLSFFIIRLDLATPFRKPWLPEGNRWVVNNMAFGSGAWRRENLLLNIAIGYPF